MTRPTSLFVLFSLAGALSAQDITMFVAPQESGISGRALSNFAGALTGGSVWVANFSVIAQPTGTPPTSSNSSSDGYVVQYRHRDDAGGALTGTYRNFEFTDFPAVHGTDRGMDSKFGSTTSPDMLEFTFNQPIGHWGAHMFDLESYRLDPAVIRAYDASDVLIYEEPVIFPNQEDGENATNNATNFVGIVSTTANISKVTITVGNTEAKYLANDLDGENVHWIGCTDMSFGSAVMEPGILRTSFANTLALGSGSTLYFDLECTKPGGATINQIDLNFSQAAGTTGSVDVYLSSDDGANWSQVSTGTAIARGRGLPTPVALANPISFGDNCSARVAIVGQGLGHACSNVALVPIASTYDNGDFVISNGEAHSGTFTGTLHSPRVPNIALYYTNGGNCRSSVVERAGVGCADGGVSVYEVFAGAPDIPSLFLRDFDGAPEASTGFAGTLDPGDVVPLGDDDQAAVGTVGVVVGSNVWVGIGGGNSNAWQVDVATMLNNPSTAVYCWKDLNPAAPGSGPVRYREYPSTSTTFPGTFVDVSYDGVYAYNTTTPHSIKFRLLVGPTGELTDCDIFLVDVPDTAGDLLVGYSLGTSSVDPGASDFSAGPVNFSNKRPLTLSAASRPSQDLSAPTTFEVTATEIPPTGLLHIGIIGISNPGLPLGFLIGATDCWLNASLETLVGPTVGPFPTGSHTWAPLVLPPTNVSTHDGLEFFVQSAILGTSENSALGLGTLTSNGLRCVVGRY